MSEQAEPIRVAIACQGGGSHTAFTAGVLSRLLQADVTQRYEIVGMSGTSGGAICALLGWAALVDGAPEKAAELLRGFWNDNSASSIPDQFVNQMVLWGGQLAGYMAIPEVSPYDNPAAVFAMQRMRTMLEDWVDFERLNQVDDGTSDRPLLILGAVDVLSGVFKAFSSRDGEITPDAVLASAALPGLFRSVAIGDGLYWDGLFSQNPPIHDLLASRPDELWVIQINPQERRTEPRSTHEITDRRGELAGNLSLYQELHVIEKIDELLETGELVGDRYKPITVRVIEMTRSENSRRLGTISKLNRDPAFVRGLITDGEATAEDFVTALRFEAAWRDRDLDAVSAFFAGPCAIVAHEPFPPIGPDADTGDLRAFLADKLATEIEVDHTRRQYAGDEFIWRVNYTDPASGERRRAQAGARFAGGQIVRFALGPTGSESAFDRRIVL